MLTTKYGVELSVVYLYDHMDHEKVPYHILLAWGRGEIKSMVSTEYISLSHHHKVEKSHK